MLTLQDFWALADETRLETEYRVDEKLKFLKCSSLETLQQVCLQYRYFTQDFPNNISTLISKMPQGNFKSLLGEILHEELGDGNPDRAHIRLYDEFLLSIGIPESTLENSLHPENTVLLHEIRGLTTSMPAAYGIGLVGMGGECLCQIYLATMNENLVQNPYVLENRAKLHWTFWDFHAGESDVIHRQKVRRAIGEFLADNPLGAEYLAAGYLKAKDNWDKFWSNNFRIALKGHPTLTV